MRLLFCTTLRKSNDFTNEAIYNFRSVIMFHLDLKISVLDLEESLKFKSLCRAVSVWLDLAYTLCVYIYGKELGR